MPNKDGKKTIFELHSNISLTPGEEQMAGRCPFCLEGSDEDPKFYSSYDLQWDCKKCGRHGNQYTFISEWLDRCLKETADEHLKHLATLKHVSMQSLRVNHVAYNRVNECYCVPTYNGGTLNNLYSYSPRQNTFYAALPHTLYSIPKERHKTVWLVEGHRDKWSTHSIIGIEPVTAIARSGAGPFKSTWCQYFTDCDLVLCEDNDRAGEAGRERVLKRFESSPHKPASISFIDWQGKPDGYDLSDCLLEHGTVNPDGSISGQGAWDEIQTRIRSIVSHESAVHLQTSTVEATPCKDFGELMEKAREFYHIPLVMEQAILSIVCSIYSIKLEGEQLWFRVFGRAGAGKSSIAKFVSASEQVVLRSTFTGLHSGYETKDGSDASLIPIIANRTLVVKDADSLLNEANIAKIWGQLRDFYDKDSSAQYLNKVSHEYRNVRSTFVLMGTNALRNSDNSYLGERFLDFNLDLTDEDEQKIMDMVERTNLGKLFGTVHNPDILISAACKGLLEKLMSQDPPSFNSYEEQVAYLGRDLVDWCKLCGKTIAKVRCEVARDHLGNPTFDPTPEVPSRVTGQLLKLVTVAPIVLSCAPTDPRVRMLLDKITKDSMHPNSPKYKILRVLCYGPATHIKLDALLEDVDLKAITTAIYDLNVIGCLDRNHVPYLDEQGRNKFNERGAPLKIAEWSVKDELKAVLSEIDPDA